jgi:choline dehydrogenase-like flavoprotein
VSDAYDYVVVGGGSAGCIAAAELAADPGVRVLLLEAGSRAEEHPETLRADGYKDAFVNDAVFVERPSEPQPGAGGRRVLLGSGRVLGGSGSVNGMVYTRGAREDFAEWPPGWRWDEVTADFEAIEARLRVRRRSPTRWTEACISAAEACGFRRKEDLDDGVLADVIGYERMSFEGDERRSSYVAFVRDAARPNLEVRPRATAHRILVEDRRARAVAYEHDGALATAEARREIVLSAGALESPKLLMLSGIGPAAALRAAGVPVLVERPGVGENLHDHPNVPVFFHTRGEVDCRYPQLYSFYRTSAVSPLPARQSDTCFVFWPAPSAMKEAMQRMLPSQILPPWLYRAGPKALVRGAVGALFRLPGTRALVRHLFAIVVILGKPRSRGSVRLRSADPRAAPRVDPCYFAHPDDLRTMVRGVRLARRLSRAGELGRWGSRELRPGPLARSDVALARFVEQNALTTYHFAGTCRMGEGEASVVDPRLRVRGVRGLRVADASVVPTTPVSAMNAPSMLVGWRAARFIREEEGVEGSVHVLPPSA